MRGHTPRSRRLHRVIRRDHAIALTPRGRDHARRDDRDAGEGTHFDLLAEALLAPFYWACWARTTDLGIKSLARTSAASGSELKQPAKNGNRCGNELQRNAGSGDKPILPAVLHVFHLVSLEYRPSTGLLRADCVYEAISVLDDSAVSSKPRGAPIRLRPLQRVHAHREHHRPARDQRAARRDRCADRRSARRRRANVLGVAAQLVEANEASVIERRR